MRVQWIISSLVCGLGFFGCSQKPIFEGEMKCVENCGTPAWNDNIHKYNNKRVKSFGGISKVYTMEQRARSDAEVDALKKAVDDLGIYGKRKMKEVITNSGIASEVIDPSIVSDELSQFRSEGTALGSFVRYQTQEWEEMRSGVKTGMYKVYALYEIDREKADAFAKQATQAQLEVLQRKNMAFDQERAKKMIESMESDW